MWGIDSFREGQLMGIEEVLQAIRSRRREEWSEFYRDRWINFRIWVQEHPEKAAIAALATGFLLWPAFRLIISIILLLCLVAAALYVLAEPGPAVSVVAPPVGEPDSAGSPEKGDRGPAEKQS